MADLATIFYVFGIIFFFTFFVFLVALFVFLVNVRNKVNTLRTQVPLQIISRLRDGNSMQLKTLGIALVGLAISFFKNKIGKKA